MKLLSAILLLLTMTGIANAAYVNDQSFNQGNGVYLTIMNTTVNNITCCISNTLFMNISENTVSWTAGANKIITYPRYTGDNFTFDISGNSYINFSAVMVNASSSYNLSVNGIVLQTRNTTVGKMVWFNYTGSGVLSVTYSTISAPGGETGTTWRWLDGYITSNESGLAINAATVTTSKGVTTTNSLGYYSFGYVFEDAKSYWVNVSKLNYNSNNTYLLFNQDNEVLNRTLSLVVPTPPDIEEPVGLYDYTVEYKYDCDQTRAGGISFEFMKSFNAVTLFIIVILIIFILKIVQENPVVGILSAVVIIVFVGTLLPSIASWSTEVACIDSSEVYNLSDYPDIWVDLNHTNILNASETISNNSYNGILNVDYNMDYSGGHFKPLSTGNFSFGE